MLLSKAVTSAALLMVTFSAISAAPGITRERHIIHAPIKIKTIHHYKVKKIPIIIRKHLHYYKPKEEYHEKPVQEEPNPFHGEDDHGGEGYEHHDFYEKTPPNYGSSEGPHEAPEEDYDEPEQSREEEDENYDYE